MPSVAAADLRCAYEDDFFGDPWVGDPPVVLAQHGFHGNRGTFQRWVPALAPRYRVIRRALFAHDGTSAGKPGHDLSLDGLADDLVAFLDALGLERVHFLGTHTGAMSGLALAARHPDRVRSLCLLDCPPRTSGLQRRLVQGLPDGLRARYPTWSEAIRGLGGYLAWYDASRRGVDPADPVTAWQRQVVGSCEEAGMEAYVAAMHHFDVERYLPRISVPTLLVALAGSTVTTIEDQVAMRLRIPGAELCLVEDGEGPSGAQGSERGRDRRIVEIAPSDAGIPERYARFLAARFPAETS